MNLSPKFPRVCIPLFALFACLAMGWGQHVPLKVYGRIQGLKNLDVNCMIQDRTGYLWVGTEDGLYRYDGKHFQRFTSKDGLADTNITNLVQDEEGTIWIGTAVGLSVWKDGHFYTLPDNRITRGVRSNSSLTAWKGGAVFVSLQTLWYVRYESAPNQQEKHWSLVPFARDHLEVGRARSTFRDTTGILWIGCDEGICRLGNGAANDWSQVPHIPKDRWIRFVQTRDGAIWVRGQKHILYLPRGGSKFEDRTGAIGSELIADNGGPMVEDASGRLLIGTKEGIVWWKGRGWQKLDLFDRQSRNKVFPLVFDREGNLWLREAGHGILRALGYGRWESWTEEEGIIGGSVYGILHDSKDRLWVATREGLFMSPPPHRRFRHFSPELHSAVFLKSIVETSAGGIWVMSESGAVLNIDSQTLQTTEVPIGQERNLQQIVGGPDGNLWVATRDGIAILQKIGSSFAVNKLSDPASPQGNVVDITRDKNGDLIALTSDRIYLYSHHQWTVVPKPGRLAKLDLDTVAVAGDHTIWVGANDTLGRFKLENNVAGSLQLFPSKDLVANIVNFIGADSRGNVWVGSDNAVIRHSGSNWRIYSTEDGLLWDDTDRHAFFADRDGSVWIGTADGLSHFQPEDQIPEENFLPKPIIEAAVGAKVLEPSKTSVFPWKDSTLTAKISSLTYVHESSITFQYRLGGLEDVWTSSEDGIIRYPNLMPGSYTLEVHSVDDEMHRISDARSVSFTIRAPWWRRWPAETAFVLLILAVCIFLIRIWVRYLLKRKLLEEQATKDGLTKLWNRNAGIEIFQNRLVRALQQKSTLVLAMIDIDYFKHVNDSYGHLAGDMVLREVASRLQSHIRADDTAARYGGEEFILVMSGLTEEVSMQRLSSVHEAIRSMPIVCGDVSIPVTCSIGALFIDTITTAAVEFYLQCADNLLYAAKHSGRNRIEFGHLYGQSDVEIGFSPFRAVAEDKKHDELVIRKS